MKNNIVDFIGFKLTGKKLSPEQYGEVMQHAMNNKEKWVDRPIYDVNIVIARDLKGKL